MPVGERRCQIVKRPRNVIAVRACGCQACVFGGEIARVGRAQDSGWGGEDSTTCVTEFVNVRRGRFIPRGTVEMRGTGRWLEGRLDEGGIDGRAKSGNGRGEEEWSSVIFGIEGNSRSGEVGGTIWVVAGRGEKGGEAGKSDRE